MAPTPRIDPETRIKLTKEADKFWRAEARFGFIENPDVEDVLARCKAMGAEINLDDVTYYVGHETIVPREDGKGLPGWHAAAFAWMARNAARISDTLSLPHDHVVEIGREIGI